MGSMHLGLEEETDGFASLWLAFYADRARGWSRPGLSTGGISPNRRGVLES